MNGKKSPLTTISEHSSPNETTQDKNEITLIKLPSKPGPE